MKRKRLLGKNIQFLKNILNKELFLHQQNLVKFKIILVKTYTDGIRYRINKLNQLMVIGEPLNANNFTNVYEE